MSDGRLTNRRDELPPESSEYWERLAGRIEAAAADRGARTELAWLATHGVRVGGVGVTAAALLLAWVLTRATEPAASVANATPAAWRGSVAPSDSLGRTLAVDQPPALGAVLLAGTRSGAGSPERGP